jgi:1-acyl-sn-glycerol-3-phosphate acyltransferase
VLRSLAFNLLFYIWTVIMAVVGLPFLLGPRRLTVAWARAWERGIAWLLRTIAGITFEVRGRVHMTEAPVIYAVKHQSAFETLVLHLVLRDPAIALKRELTRIPLFGWYLIRTGMIRIDRTSGARALRSMVSGARGALARGSSVVVFPEGTRVAPGAERPYQPGVAGLYLQLGLKVVPVALNSGLFWSRRSFRKRPGHIVIEFLPAIEAGLDRKRFMAALRDRLEPATDRLLAEGRAR